mmetsp:Transcript_20564/g.38675  ORF Transcript_20564/g.38675 Transcript_20564/m.38675 type:complete len:221 (+) Transcript_20564:585-1247(+)
MQGRNTAGCKGGRGTSNCGGMFDRGSCFTFSRSYKAMVSGTMSVLYPNSLRSNILEKSVGSSSGSCRQHLRRSANASISGTWTGSLNSGLSISTDPNLVSSDKIIEMTPSKNAWLSSRLMYLSVNVRADPKTTTNPLFKRQAAPSGLLAGKDIFPEVMMGVAGLSMARVHPKGYTRSSRPPLPFSSSSFSSWSSSGNSEVPAAVLPAYWSISGVKDALAM